MSEKNINKSPLKIGITMGDPNGIGPEITIKALNKMKNLDDCQTIIFGDLKILQEMNKLLQSNLQFINYEKYEEKSDKIPVIDLSVYQDRDWTLGKMSAWGGASAFKFLLTAIEWAKDEKIAAIVTCPLSKEALHAAGYQFPGHTEILSYYTNKAKPYMMLNVENMRAIHVTTHMSLKKAISSLTTELILETILCGNQTLKDLGFNSPNLGIPGLNPHSGENGIFGSEEKEIIIPAIEAAKKQGVLCGGPVPPDVIFYQHKKGVFDAVIALYHDQGHIPLKLMGFEKGVNVTLGLPIIRTSVAHGTAFDCAPLLKANPTSLIKSYELAYKMAQSKKFNNIS